MSTHGPQHDEFGAQSTPQHGGAEYDGSFDSFAAAHSNAHGKLFDKFSKRPGVDRYGEHWDEFSWTEMPSLHGTHFDEGFNSPSFDGGEHGQLHDVFRGARVRYMYGGQDVEGIVLDTQADFAVVESREGEKHEVTLGQLLAYATGQGNPHAGKKPVEALDQDSGDITAVETGSEQPGPQGERPSHVANGGERVEGGSYDDSVFSNKGFTDALEVVKSLAPFDEAQFDRDSQEFADVAKSSDGTPGVAHLPTKKLTEAHSKFSDHYAAARLTGNHERAHFAAHVLASIHHELATRGVMAEHPDVDHPTTRGVQPGHVKLKTTTEDSDVSKATGIGKHFYTQTGIGKARYVTNHHDGVKTHSDGSAFYDIAIHNNKRDHEAFVSGLRKQGYSEGSGMKSVTDDSDVSKDVDAGETAVQSKDDTNQGANWCKTCQHYCRRVVQGHCPTCGGPVGVKKNWMSTLDVLKESPDAS